MENVLSLKNENKGPQTVMVRAIRAKAVRDMDWGPVYRRMPKRMERAGRYRFERDRLLCVAAGLLMLEFVGLSDESELRYGAYGRPCAPGHIDFNLSHSGEWCVLATGAADVGVDIERIDAANLRVAPMVLTAAERAWMAESPLERFHILWTLKESVMKASGLGMNLKPDSFEVLPFFDHAPITLLGRSWHAAFGELGGYRFGVCASYPMHIDFSLWPSGASDIPFGGRPRTLSP